MTKNDIGTIILNWLKGFFTKNLALKIVSLLFAMLIWGYVMVEVNPKRVKTITDVPISFPAKARCMIAVLPCAATGTIYSET